MSQPPKRGIPVSRKGNAGTCKSNLPTTSDSQSSLYKKTTVNKTMVQTRSGQCSQNVPTAAPRQIPTRSGLRPPSNAGPRPQQSQLRAPSSRQAQTSTAPPCKPAGSKLPQTGSRIGTTGSALQRPRPVTVAQQPRPVTAAQPRPVTTAQPRSQIVPPSAPRSLQQPRAVAGPATRQIQQTSVQRTIPGPPGGPQPLQIQSSQVTIEEQFFEEPPPPQPQRQIAASSGIRPPAPSRLQQPTKIGIPTRTAAPVTKTHATTQIRTSPTRPRSPGYPSQLPLSSPKRPRSPQRVSPPRVVQEQAAQDAAGYAQYGAIPKRRLQQPTTRSRRQIQQTSMGPSTSRTVPLQPTQPPGLSSLEKELECVLQETAKGSKSQHRGTASKRSIVPTPLIMTEEGPMPVDTQIINRKSVIKEPGMPEIIARDLIGIQAVGEGISEKTEVAVQRTKPLKRSQLPKTREVVTVESSVKIGAGIQQSIKTVSFDGDPSHLQPMPPKPSPQKVALLVQEEADLVNQLEGLPMPEVKHVSPSSYVVRKRAAGFTLDPHAVAALEQSILESGIKHIPDPEEPTPEMIAHMLNAEERGLEITAEPAQVIEFLFPEGSQGDKTIEVTSAAPAPLQDVVIPTTMPDLGENKNNEEINIIADKALRNLDMNEVEAASYCATVGEEPIPPKNLAKKGGKTKRKRITLLDKEAPPWGIQDVPPVIDLVGAQLAESKVPFGEAAEQVDPFLEGIEYLLEMEAPAHNTLIQLRGSSKPPWFPGYVVALPDNEKLITFAKSPSMVLSSAWKAVQPDIFNDDSLFLS